MQRVTVITIIIIIYIVHRYRGYHLRSSVPCDCEFRDRLCPVVVVLIGRGPTTIFSLSLSIIPDSLQAAGGQLSNGSCVISAWISSLNLQHHRQVPRDILDRLVTAVHQSRDPVARRFGEARGRRWFRELGARVEAVVGRAAAWAALAGAAQRRVPRALGRGVLRTAA